MVAKLRYELNPSSLLEEERFIIDDDYLMSHLIDEILLFDNELRNIHGYPKPYDSAIVVLLEEGPLCRWLNLEKHCKWAAGVDLTWAHNLNSHLEKFQ